MMYSRLIQMADAPYKDFQSALLPTLAKEKILGVRIPALRKLAKELYGTKEANEFITRLPHKYYDEDNLHAFLIAQIKDFDSALEQTELFLPYIDNWATCDSFNPKVFASFPERLLPKINVWLLSEHEYTVRYAIKLLMMFFLDQRFDERYMQDIAGIKRDEYYIKMMIAWYFATALSKQYDTAVKYLENGSLTPWIRNKAIQKAIESYRVTDPNKQYLKSIR